MHISVQFPPDKLPEDGAVQLELTVEDRPVLSGTWSVRIWRGHKTLRPVGEWTETCTYRENGCEYREIDLPLSGDYRLQRFFLLSEDDRLLLIGDTILWDGDSPRKRRSGNDLWYESLLPYSPRFLPQEQFYMEDHLTFHRGKSPALRVMPLTLEPELEPDLGSFCAIESKPPYIRFRQSDEGQSMFVAMLFDLDRKRLKKPFSWQQLTVGEDLRSVPTDRAVGYRIQLGKANSIHGQSARKQAAVFNKARFAH